jgi:hypothetical protein
MARQGERARRWGLAAAGAGLLGLLAACGPSAPPPKADRAKEAAPAPPPSPVDNLKELSTALPLSPPLSWNLAERVTVTPDSAPAATGGGHAVIVTATPENGLHRIGVSGNFGGGEKTYHVTVWVKAAPGTDAMLEARGQTFTNGMPNDYAVSYFDLANIKLQPNSLVTDKSKFPAAGITADGDWRKLTADMKTHDGWIHLVIGVTSKGAHIFPGRPDTRLVVGGVQIQPG